MKRKTIPCASPAALLFLLLALVGLTGCVSAYRVTPVRSGALYPSKGEACSIQFQNMNFQEASAKYEHLGLINLSGAEGGEFTPQMKKDVERAACKMGADAVSLNASVQNNFQFLVWRAR
jgi:hypothetical protein